MTNNNDLPRVFKTGSVRIQEDASTRHLTNEGVREVLKTAYPEVAHATVRERVDEDAGLVTVEFLPQPGRKG